MRLFESLLALKEEKLISFHVPGHKYSQLYQAYFGKLDSVLEIDLTEIPGTDDLFDASSCIARSQNYLSNHLNTHASYYLVGGTTSGIYAMIMASTKPGEKILVARDCHRAVYDAALLGHLEVVLVDPVFHNGMCLGIRPEDVKNAVKNHPDAKALVLTYPNYYGIGTDLKEIRTILKDMLLLVDEAHGAHLFMGDAMPSSLTLGADLVVHSSHKTLPVMTQASVIHLNSKRVSKKRLEAMLKLHQTSSPSYVLMSSLDIGYEICFKQGYERMIDLHKNIEIFTQNMPYFLKQDDLPNGFILDKSKLTLMGQKSNIDPMDLEKQLRKNGIQLEFSNDKFAVFVTSIMNDKKDFEYLTKTMEMLKFKCYSGIDNIDISYTSNRKISLTDAFYREKKYVKLRESIGEISSDYIIPYPPGIPFILPGELIDKNKYELIKEMLDKGINISGLRSLDDEIEVLSGKEA